MVWPIRRKEVQQVFGLFIWRGPCPLDSVWIIAGSFVSAFIPAFKKCRQLKEHRRGYQRVKSKPSSPWDSTGRGIRHRPSHPWLYSAFVGGQRGFRLPLFALFLGWVGASAAIECMDQFSEFTSLITPHRRRIFVFILKPRLFISVGVRCQNMPFQKLSVLGALNVGA